MTVYVLEGNELERLADLVAARIAIRQTTPAPTTPWMTCKEAAEYLRLPVDGIYSRVAKRQIPFHKIGGRTLFDRVELDDWVRG